jgi:D-xylose transport system permease protein
MSNQTVNASPAPQATQGFSWQSITRIFRGDLGQGPVLAALIVMSLYFQSDSQGLFLSSRNLSNLVLQSAVGGVISLAAVMVLLIGEIDLSLAAVSNLCGAVMMVLIVYHGFSPFFAVLAGLLTGVVIGTINGFLVAYLRVPSFIVTLAGLIGYSGLLLHVLLPNTTIILRDPGLLSIASSYVSLPLSLVVGIGAIVAYAAINLGSQAVRRRDGLKLEPQWQVYARIGAVAVALIIALSIFDNYLGVPYLAVILIGLILIFWLLLRFTTFGKHVYAVGGNAEAARRAGINVLQTRVIVFALTSGLAAVGGILEVSRSTTASAQVSNVLLLNAIAAAVIGGVSLFGGRGSPWAVVLGSLLIYGLFNGLTLQGRTSDIQQMVEGIVLILAVILDALLRRRSAVTGR